MSDETKIIAAIPVNYTLYQQRTFNNCLGWEEINVIAILIREDGLVEGIVHLTAEGYATTHTGDEFDYHICGDYGRTKLTKAQIKANDKKAKEEYSEWEARREAREEAEEQAEEAFEEIFKKKMTKRKVKK